MKKIKLLTILIGGIALLAAAPVVATSCSNNGGGETTNDKDNGKVTFTTLQQIKEYASVAHYAPTMEPVSFKEGEATKITNFLNANVAAAHIADGYIALMANTSPEKLPATFDIEIKWESVANTSKTITTTIQSGGASTTMGWKFEYVNSSVFDKVTLTDAEGTSVGVGVYEMYEKLDQETQTPYTYRFYSIEYNGSGEGSESASFQLAYKDFEGKLTVEPNE